MSFRTGIILFSAVAVFLSPAHAETQWMRVVVPVANLRSEPKDAAPDTYVHDPLQESQLLYGERVLVHDIKDDWALVEGVDQIEYTHKKKWEGYPGWIKIRVLGKIETSGSRAVVRRAWAYMHANPNSISEKIIRVPFGSFIKILNEKENWCEVSAPSGRAWMRRRDLAFESSPPAQAVIQTRVWKNVRGFIGVPYYWGGLSPYHPKYKEAVTGVDCSGLTHLAYRAAGIEIPRDSHEQWMMSAPVKRADLKRGDLVFLANVEKPERVVHVAMYVGGDFLIEGPGTGLKVHRVTFRKKFGKRLGKMESGDTVGKKVVYFGRPVW